VNFNHLDRPLNIELSPFKLFVCFSVLSNAASAHLQCHDTTDATTDRATDATTDGTTARAQSNNRMKVPKLKTLRRKNDLRVMTEKRVLVERLMNCAARMISGSWAIENVAPQE